MTLSAPSVAEVRSIITTSLTDDQVTAAIETATLVADGCPSIALMDATRQKAIVKWVTAHFISVQDEVKPSSRTLASKSIGDASESYVNASLGEQLRSTRYGQQALLIDTSGCLATIGQRKAFIRVV